MLSNIIPIRDWKPELIPMLECLYGYSHKHFGYLPFKEINDIIRIGKTTRIGVKGIDENDEKLYIQLSIKDQKAIKDKNWLDLDKYGLSNMKIVPYNKISRWDKVILDIDYSRINEINIEGVMDGFRSNHEIQNDDIFTFLGHLKENANNAILQLIRTKAIYLIPKDKIKKV